MNIKAYLKPQCGWSNGVRGVLRKHGLAFEDIDIINNRANYAEMVQKSGQPLSPCVEIDGVMLKPRIIQPLLAGPAGSGVDFGAGGMTGPRGVRHQGGEIGERKVCRISRGWKV